MSKCKNCRHGLYNNNHHVGFWDGRSRRVMPLHDCKFCGCTNPEPQEVVEYVTITNAI